jgi:hypothetical protein
MIVDKVRRTRDGYISCDARVARTGIQEYRGWEVGKPDMDVVRVYRPESEVFSKDALKSFAHRPVTVDHPTEMVTADNWKEFAVGHTGDEILRDGEYLRVPMVLMDSAAIAAVEGGKKQLSMGYTCDVSFESGVTPSGEAYDAVQTDIRGNHLAIVSAARGGPALQIGDDSTEGNDKMEKLTPVLVDGLEVQVSDSTAPILKKFLDAAETPEEKAKRLEEEAAAAEAAKAKDAEIVTLKSQLEAATPTPEQLDASIEKRAKTRDKARALLGDVLVTEGKTDADIRRQVVTAKVGDESKEWSDLMVEASFNTLAASLKKDARGNPLADAIRDGVKHSINDKREEAYQEHLTEMTNAWKTPSK